MPCSPGYPKTYNSPASSARPWDHRHKQLCPVLCKLYNHVSSAYEQLLLLSPSCCNLKLILSIVSALLLTTKTLEAVISCPCSMTGHDLIKMLSGPSPASFICCPHTKGWVPRGTGAFSYFPGGCGPCVTFFRTSGYSAITISPPFFLDLPARMLQLCPRYLLLSFLYSSCWGSNPEIRAFQTRVPQLSNIPSPLLIVCFLLPLVPIELFGLTLNSLYSPHRPCHL